MSDRVDQTPEGVIGARESGAEHLPHVFLWLGQPDVGTEHLLMVLTDDTEQGGTVFRPLMAVDVDTAHALADLAAQAAVGLGVTAVLREYQMTSLLDRVHP